MTGDEFEWDDAKAAENLRKHRLSFSQACRVFDDDLLVIESDTSADHGEERYLAIGMVEGVVLLVVFTERGDRTRIISARRASSYERRLYYRS